MDGKGRGEEEGEGLVHETMNLSQNLIWLKGSLYYP